MRNSLITYCSSIADLDRCALSPLTKEVLIEPRTMGRLGVISFEAACGLARAATERGLLPVLVWDILMTEREFLHITAGLSPETLSVFKAARVYDVGAANWVYQHTGLPLHIMCEVANKNISSLQGWQELFPERVARLVLSYELPETLLAEMRKSISCEVEVLAAGPIELFYSPRALLSPNFSKNPDAALIQVGSRTPESPNRVYPTVESDHGTFMYLHKDRNVLDRISYLEGIGIDAFRIDLRRLSSASHSAEGIAEIASALVEGTLPSWPTPSAAPFRVANNTTRRFAKLRSKRAGMRDERFLGEVVASQKPRYTVVRVLPGTTLSGPYRLLLPEGDERIIEELQFRHISTGEIIEECHEEQLLVTPWIKRANPGAMIIQG